MIILCLTLREIDQHIILMDHCFDRTHTQNSLSVFNKQPSGLITYKCMVLHKIQSKYPAEQYHQLLHCRVLSSESGYRLYRPTEMGYTVLQSQQLLFLHAILQPTTNSLKTMPYSLELCPLCTITLTLNPIDKLINK